jgi:hypothetical protein
MSSLICLVTMDEWLSVCCTAARLRHIAATDTAKVHL